MLRATQSRWCSVLVCFLLWSSSCRESLGFQYQAFIASPPDCGVAETRKRATATTATGSQRFGGWGTYGRNQNNNEPSFNTVLSKNRIRLMKRFSSRRSSEANNDDPSEEKRTTKYDDISKNIKIALENDRITRLRDDQTKVALVKALLKMEDNDLMSIQLVGKTDLPTTSSRVFRRDMTIPCAMLTTTNTDHDRNRDDPIPAILLPLDEDGENQWTLLQSSMEQPKQATGRMRSVVQQFQWNAALVNRDGGLFDNLPYSTWTMDPNRKLRDASNNVMASKFHPGKRYAYNRLMLLSGRNNNAQYNVMSNVENKRNDNVPMDSGTLCLCEWCHKMVAFLRVVGLEEKRNRMII